MKFKVPFFGRKKLERGETWHFQPARRIGAVVAPFRRRVQLRMDGAGQFKNFIGFLQREGRTLVVERKGNTYTLECGQGSEKTKAVLHGDAPFGLFGGKIWLDPKKVSEYLKMNVPENGRRTLAEFAATFGLGPRKQRKALGFKQFGKVVREMGSHGLVVQGMQFRQRKKKKKGAYALSILNQRTGTSQTVLIENLDKVKKLPRVDKPLSQREIYQYLHMNLGENPNTTRVAEVLAWFKR